MNERKLNCRMWATKTKQNKWKWKSKNFLLAPFRGFLSSSINSNESTERIIGELLRIMQASSTYLLWLSCLPIWYQAVLIVLWNWRTGVQNYCFVPGKYPPTRGRAPATLPLLGQLFASLVPGGSCSVLELKDWCSKSLFSLHSKGMLMTTVGKYYLLHH